MEFIIEMNYEEPKIVSLVEKKFQIVQKKKKSI